MDKVFYLNADTGKAEKCSDYMENAYCMSVSDGGSQGPGYWWILFYLVPALVMIPIYFARNLIKTKPIAPVEK